MNKLVKIKPTKVPNCDNCQYFKAGRCKSFGMKNMRTGLLEYEFAYMARLQNTKCGYYGVYYQEKDKDE